MYVGLRDVTRKWHFSKFNENGVFWSPNCVNINFTWLSTKDSFVDYQIFQYLPEPVSAWDALQLLRSGRTLCYAQYYSPQFLAYVQDYLVIKKLRQIIRSAGTDFGVPYISTSFIKRYPTTYLLYPFIYLGYLVLIMTLS